MFMVTLVTFVVAFVFAGAGSCFTAVVIYIVAVVVTVVIPDVAVIFFC